MLERLSFARLLGGVLALSFLVGFVVFVLTVATTNKGTPSAIEAEYAAITNAENTRCTRYGAYAPISTLRSEGLLTFRPIYNSVVFLPGKHCGTIVIGSAAFQASAG
jgi:hypothetical protein